jgi:hypothetical protein
MLGQQNTKLCNKYIILNQIIDINFYTFFGMATANNDKNKLYLFLILGLLLIQNYNTLLKS